MTTTTPRTFIDIHVLQTVPPSCINRDENGTPKSAIFGGVPRARVSSQAWKKAAREAFTEIHETDLDFVGERTIYVVDRIAEQITTQASEITATQAQDAAAKVLKEIGIKTSQTKPKKSEDGDSPASRDVTGYLIFLSRGQINALAKIGVEVARGEKVDKKLAKEAFNDENAVAVALFGRMIAEVPDLNVDAATQVSHALSVHAAKPEYDFFTAVDDDSQVEHAGAGMMGTVEFVSSTLYRYATVNATQLLKNLGSKPATLNAIDAFIRAFLLSMPTGKQSTFANRTRPGVVLVEIREDQPVNLSAAFEEPVPAEGGALVTAAKKLVGRALAEDSAFNSAPIASAILVADQAATQAVEPILDRAQLHDLDGVVNLIIDTLEQRLQDA